VLDPYWHIRHDVSSPIPVLSACSPAEVLEDPCLLLCHGLGRIVFHAIRVTAETEVKVLPFFTTYPIYSCSHRASNTASHPVRSLRKRTLPYRRSDPPRTTDAVAMVFYPFPLFSYGASAMPRLGSSFLKRSKSCHCKHAKRKKTLATCSECGVTQVYCWANGCEKSCQNCDCGSCDAAFAIGAPANLLKCVTGRDCWELHKGVGIGLVSRSCEQRFAWALVPGASHSARCAFARQRSLVLSGKTDVRLGRVTCTPSVCMDLVSGCSLAPGRGEPAPSCPACFFLPGVVEVA